MLLHTHARVWVSVCSWLVSNHSKIPAFIYSAYSGFVRTLVAFVMKYCVLWCWQVNIPLSFPHLVLFFLETFEPQLKSFLLTWHNKFLVVKTTLNTRFTQISENSVGTSTLIQQKGHINRQNKKSIPFGWWLICDNCYVH